MGAITPMALKEAFVKADGRGLSTRLDDFHVVDLKEKITSLISGELS
jgi:phosphopantetheinyl transferase